MRIRIPHLPRNLLTTSHIASLDGETRTMLARAYFVIYRRYRTEYTVVKGRNTPEWFLYYADRFDRAFVEAGRERVDDADYQFILHMRSYE